MGSTIFSKSDYPVTIKSSPSALSVEVTNSAGEIVYKGTTPSTIVLPAAKGMLFAPETYTFKLFKDNKAKWARELSVPIIELNQIPSLVLWEPFGLTDFLCRIRTL